jgi:hypothetical protein
VLLIAFDAQTSLFTALVSLCNSLTCGQQHVQTPIMSSVVITLGGSSSGSSSSSSVLPVAAGGPTYRVGSKQQRVSRVLTAHLAMMSSVLLLCLLLQFAWSGSVLATLHGDSLPIICE